MDQPAARQTDAVSHVQAEAGPITQGSGDVKIGNLPAARLGDKVKHKTGSETIAEGEPSVKINGKPAARMGDKVACNGIIVGGCLSVMIGRDKDETCLLDAASDGATLVQPA